MKKITRIMKNEKLKIPVKFSKKKKIEDQLNLHELV
jgi:hypothetical protein